MVSYLKREIEKACGIISRGAKLPIISKRRISKKRCYRCGDYDHAASICRNAVTFFRCGKLGHISRNCHQITLLPQSLYPPLLRLVSSPPSDSLHPSVSLTVAPSRVLRFVENDLSARLEAEAGRGVIIVANDRVNQNNLLAALRFCFPCQGHQWTVRFLGDHCYLVDASAQW